MFHFELTDSGAPATYGEPVDLLRDRWDGMGQVNPNIKALSGDSSLSLALYNYVANPPHHRERLQFATEFPLLAKAVYAAQTRSVWRELGEIVDKLKSPVRFLSKALKVATCGAF